MQKQLYCKGNNYNMMIEYDKMQNAGFVKVTDIIPDAILEMRYYSTFNFVGERIDSYNSPVAYLTKEATNNRLL